MEKTHMERIERLKRKKNAIVIAHNYVRAEVKEVAEFVGDALELSRVAMETSADVIIACGVYFMAETTAVLCPDKKVIIPDRAAKCPMAQQLLRADLLEAKKENPDDAVVLYANTLAETKALADCICTSANAPRIVEAVDGSSPVLFGPDRNLAYYVKKRTSSEIISVPECGLCPMHHQITLEDLIKAKEAHPRAKIVAHPECIPEVQDNADYIASTSGMVKICKEAENKEFLIATEVGLLDRLKEEAPNKIFYPVSTTAVCPQMKMPTLVKIEKALEKEKPEVVVPREIAVDARRAMERMLELS